MNESADTMNVPRSGAWTLFGVFAFVGTVPWWSLAVPGGLLVGFVVP